MLDHRLTGLESDLHFKVVITISVEVFMKKQQTRGKDLRKKMMDSEKQGEDYRDTHGGRDTVEPDVPRRGDQKSQHTKK
jgi:hypothetical protein